MSYLLEGAQLSSCKITPVSFLPGRKAGCNLIQMRIAEVKLCFDQPGRDTQEFRVHADRLGNGAFKVAYALGEVGLVLEVIPRAGQNKAAWPADVLQELNIYEEKTDVRHFFPKYYGGFFMNGGLDDAMHGPSTADPAATQAAVVVCEQACCPVSETWSRQWLTALRRKLGKPTRSPCETSGCLRPTSWSSATTCGT